MSWNRLAIGFGVGAALVVCGSARAQSTNDAPESPIHSIARLMGLATEPPPPAEFVRDSRPNAPTNYAPVFRPYDEPGSKVKSKDDLNAMGQDLQKVDDAHDKLRADFPPSADAMSQKKAADAARKAAKPAPSPKPSATN